MLAGNVFPRSWYLFRKLFSGVLSSRWKQVDICIKEHHIFAPGETNCPKCNEARCRTLALVDSKTKQVPRKWFYSMSIIDQINRRFFSDPDWVKVRKIPCYFVVIVNLESGLIFFSCLFYFFVLCLLFFFFCGCLPIKLM